MRFVSLSFVFSLAAVAILLSACSDNELEAEPLAREGLTEFGEEEKKAARVLSISNTDQMASAGTPYSKALLCRHGIAEVAKLVRSSPAVNREQQEGLRQAETLYDQRLRDLAAADGKSLEDIQQDLEQTAMDNQEQTTNARVAVGCLEQLQEE